MTKSNHPVWDNEQLLREEALQAESIGDMLGRLGLNRNSGNYQTLKSRCTKYEIPIPVYDQTTHMSKLSTINSASIEELFSDRGRKSSSGRLKSLMISHFNVENICALCGQLPEWFGKPLVLELDHIDGNSFNNCIDNLRILCGHCHSQTSNFRGRNKTNKVYSYCQCGRKISKGAHNCRSCEGVRKSIATTNWDRYPSIEKIYEIYIEVGTFVALGKKLGVSDNGVRKHIKRLGISIEDFKQGSLV